MRKEKSFRLPVSPYSVCYGNSLEMYLRSCDRHLMQFPLIPGEERPVSGSMHSWNNGTENRLKEFSLVKDIFEIRLRI